jgi:hypothetical protein
MGAVALFLSFMHFAAAGIDPTDRCKILKTSQHMLGVTSMMCLTFCWCCERRIHARKWRNISAAVCFPQSGSFVQFTSSALTSKLKRMAEQD